MCIMHCVTLLCQDQQIQYVLGGVIVLILNVALINSCNSRLQRVTGSQLTQPGEIHNLSGFRVLRGRGAQVSSVGLHLSSLRKASGEAEVVYSFLWSCLSSRHLKNEVYDQLHYSHPWYPMRKEKTQLLSPERSLRYFFSALTQIFILIPVPQKNSVQNFF